MENKQNIGELDTLVTLQSCVITSGAEGQKTSTFSDHSRVFAKVDLNVDEMARYSNLEECHFIGLVCYKVAGLTTRWRVIVDGQKYEITAIDPISRVSPLCRLTLRSIDE